ncbi:MAG: exopolysaccharide biosynthesis polyprenyl glycosylphosphotransferase [Epsilonproteobacteria bacterium]|nr:exopolysaccharide biosynthesis polyprenyl glycosylphosphotransferase [Campylobacterota bacterium]
MKKRIQTLITIILDIFFLIGLFYLTSYFRGSLSAEDIPAFSEIRLKHFSFVIVIIVFLLYLEKVYTLKYDFWQESYKVIKVFFIAYLLVLTILALSKANLEYSRLFLTLYFFLGALLMPVFKRYSKKLLYLVDSFKSKVLLVGVESEVERFKKELVDNWYLGMTPVESECDSVIIISKSLEPERLNEHISQHLEESRELFIVPYITDINFAHSSIIEYSNIRYNTILVENRLLLKHNIWIKSFFEYLLTLLILPLFLPIHLLISFLIKLDSKGSIFFKQERMGKDAKAFNCYKYRTMYENSDALLAEYLKKNPDEVSYYEEYHKYKNDPRITKIGKFLRATSLDELAQVINVLKGEMSLIGPRPYMLSESVKLGEHQKFILKVKPGITGLWQVSGRNNLTFKERNELEVWYIKNWSLWSDFVILIKTIKVVFLKVGAK